MTSRLLRNPKTPLIHGYNSRGTGRVGRCHVKAATVKSQNVSPTPTIADVEVTFKLEKHVEYGSRLCLIGADDKLGCWEPEKSVSLDWSDGDVWTVACRLPVG
jgi:hypothetical protein